MPVISGQTFGIKLRYKAWRLESTTTIEEVSRKMRDTASETLALPLEEAASSLSSTSMFDVGRSMFDVHLFPSLNRHALGELLPHLLRLHVLETARSHLFLPLTYPQPNRPMGCLGGGSRL